jgi:regulator of sigma E protease
MSVFLLVVGLLLFVSLVVVHEFGHFIAARRNGVEVEEFGIFFPPAIYKRKTKGGWIFSINLLPLGGFVRLKGEHDSDTEPGTYGAASLKAKSLIMSAGVLMNLVTALILFTFVALIGMPKLVDNQFTVKSDTQLLREDILVGYIEPGSPAAKSGLRTRDAIVGISQPGYSPVTIKNSAELPKVTKQFAGKEVKLFYTRDGKNEVTKTKLRSTQEVEASRKTSSPKGYLGIVPADYTVQRSTWSAPIVAVGVSVQLTGLTFEGLGHALAGLGGLIAGGVTGNNEARQNGQAAATENVSGPVGIFEVLKSGSVIGYEFILFVIAYISLTLAIMNILPIPALDGGRLWLTLLTRGLKRPLSEKQEEMINAIGFLLLLLLIILITIVDVKRFY